MTEGAGQVLTVAEAAAALQVSERHARDLVHRGQIPALRWGRTIRIPRVQFDALLAGTTTTNTTPTP